MREFRWGVMVFS